MTLITRNSGHTWSSWVIGYYNSTQWRLKWQWCDIFLQKAYRLDQRIWGTCLLKKQLCATVNKCQWPCQRNRRWQLSFRRLAQQNAGHWWVNQWSINLIFVNKKSEDKYWGKNLTQQKKGNSCQLLTTSSIPQSKKGQDPLSTPPYYFLSPRCVQSSKPLWSVNG